ncbi:MAG TPA: hypothetical protein VG186_12250 [Solirubrobacteraceae bacterium]|jgi:hypothetical protein|nr:hypothetical protein [Solirubrobacteraceae bacterium]
MAEEKRDRTAEPESTEAARETAREIEDLAPTEQDSDAVKGGAGWNRVKNIEG